MDELENPEDRIQVKYNEIKVAGRDYRIYLGECDRLFNRFDQIVLVAREKYKEKLLYIQRMKMSLGVVIDKEYMGSAGLPKFKIKVIEIINEQTGRREIIEVFYLGLTKIPELFMFTDPDRVIEPPSIDQVEEKG